MLYFIVMLQLIIRFLRIIRGTQLGNLEAASIEICLHNLYRVVTRFCEAKRLSIFNEMRRCRTRLVRDEVMKSKQKTVSTKEDEKSAME